MNPANDNDDYHENIPSIWEISRDNARKALERGGPMTLEHMRELQAAAAGDFGKFGKLGADGKLYDDPNRAPS